MLKRFLKISLFLWVAILPGLAVAQMDPHKGPMPDLIWGPTYEGVPDVPIWVAADRVLTESGDIDREILTENAANWIRQELMQDERKYGFDADKGCLVLHSPGDHHNTPEPHWQDFSSVVADSELILAAQVTGSKTGFTNFGIGGTLLRLKPLRWLKGDGAWKSKYLFVPFGDLKLGEKSFCIRHDQFSRIPEEGFRVVVAYDDIFTNRELPRLYTTAPRIVTLWPGGKVGLPGWVRQKHPTWSNLPEAAFLGVLERMIQAEGSSHHE